LPEEIRFPKYKIHKGAFYTSKPINTEKISELLNSLDLSSEKINIQKSEQIFLKDSEEIPPIKSLPQTTN